MYRGLFRYVRQDFVVVRDTQLSRDCEESVTIRREFTYDLYSNQKCSRFVVARKECPEQATGRTNRRFGGSSEPDSHSIALYNL